MKLRLAFIGMVALPLAAHAALRTIAGPDGGAWDYASVDAAAGRVYVARSTSVTSFDLTGKSAPQALGTFSHGHGVLPIPGTNHLLVSSGDDESVRVLDSASGTQLARIAVGKDPDAEVIDALNHRVFVMNAKDGTVSVIDLKTNAVEKTIALKPGLEFGAIGSDGTLFINNEDENEMELVDTTSLRAKGAMKLTGCEGPSGLAYDKATDQLIAACANKKVAVVKAHSRQLARLLPTGEGPDAVILDATRRRAYVPCGKSGELTVLSLDGAQGARVTGTIKTALNARTGALDPQTGKVYLPTADLAPPAPGQHRGSPIPGSFRLVVVQPQ